MRGTRLVPAALAVGAGFALLVDPAAAQGFDSITEQLIRELNAKLLALAIPVTVIVEGILIYTVWKFRNNDDPQPTKENRELEITWTVATAVILLFVGFASYGVMANPNVIATPDTVENVDGDPVVVQAKGFQWFWRFNYTEQNVTGVEDEMVVPVDRPLVIRTASNDVIHAFHVPELGLKQDAIPGQTNVIKTVPTDTGTYTLYCAEYCGAGHSRMLANVTVVSQERYQDWLAEQKNASG